MFDRFRGNRNEIEILIWMSLPFFLISNLRDAIEQAYYWLLLTDEPFLIGDWLINYQGGFVRRGLLGELLLKVHQFFDIDLELLVFMMITLWVVFYFLFTGLILLQKKSLFGFVLILFSPFFLRFHQFNHLLAFRKEIIALALTAFLTWLTLKKNKALLERFFFGVLLLYPFVILSHEALIINLPYMMIIYGLNICIDRRKMIIISLLSALSLLTFFLCLSHPGSVSQINSICDAIVPYTNSGRLSDCATVNTSIGYLQLSAQDWRGKVIEQIKLHYYLPIYLNALWLSAIAYIPRFKSLRKIFSNKLFFSIYSVSILATILVCSVAIDWGRFIYMNLVPLCFVSLAEPEPEAVHDQGFVHLLKEKLKAVIAHKRDYLDYGMLLLIAVMVFLYAKFWFIPGCCYSDSEYFPLAPFGKDVVTFFGQLVP